MPLSALSALALFALGGPEQAQAQASPYGARIGFEGGVRAKAVAVADLDRDGGLDLVIANWGPDVMSVLMANGNTTYAPRVVYATGGAPVAIAIGDVNADGHLDVVTANSLGASVSVFLGDGTGAFGSRTDYAVGESPASIALGDIDGDGDPDMAVANGSSVSLLLNSGAGGFGARNDVVTSSAALAVALGDLNNDGRLDMVVTLAIGEMNMLLGNGKGEFSTSATHTVGATPKSVALGDVNGDRRLDVVVANAGTNTASVLLGNASGGLNPKTDYVCGSLPQTVALGDVTGDGRLDIVTANYSAIQIAVLPGNGNGTFSAAVASGFLNDAPNLTTLADLNDDGRLDFVVTYDGFPNQFIILGAGADLGPATAFAVGNSPMGVAVADLNGDARLDLVTTNNGSNTASVLLANGSGGYVTRVDYATGVAPRALALADVNNDGRRDLITANAVSTVAGSVSVLLGTVTGTFGPKTDFVTGAGSRGLAVGDLNNDGRRDIVTTNYNGNTVSVLLGTGTGSFGAKTDFATPASPWGVALGDLNGDGRLDIVTANHGGGTGSSVSVLLGTGTGSFGAASNFLVGGTAPMSVALADLDADTRLDIVTANGGNSVSILFGTGSGTFSASITYPTGTGSRTVVVADVNADSRLDVLTANETDNTVSVLIGSKSGGFYIVAPRVDLPTSQAPWGLAAADLNGDGRADVITTNLVDATAAVLLAKNPSRVTITVDPTIPLPGTNYTLRANVSTTFTASGTPTGTVRFYDRSTLLASVPVVSGIATYTTSNMQLAGHTLTATYTGDERHTASSASLEMPSDLAPRIVRVGDVPNDQGGRVSVQWYASALDRTPNNPLYQYNIWRQVPGSFATSRLQQGEYRVGAAREAMLDRRVLRTTAQGSQVFFWEFLASTGARGFTGYSYLASTAADSTGVSNPRTAFMVEAMDYNLSGWSSAPDSGYSVDNLPPATPTPFSASYIAGATTLRWGRNREADLAGYRLYRGASAGFTPSAANRIAAPSDTSFADAGPAGSYYKLSAVDSHGNESPYAIVTPGGTTDVDGTIVPDRAFLEPPSPNPVRAQASIAFGLPKSMSVSLGVYDVNGRQVRTLAEGMREAGRHTAAWDLRDANGRLVPGGMYFARLRTDDRVWTQRFAVVR